jgi:hypothetical protein
MAHLQEAHLVLSSGGHGPHSFLTKNIDLCPLVAVNTTS